MLEYSGDIQRLRFDMSEVPDGTSFSRVLPGLIRQSDDVIVQMQEVEASDMDSMAKEMAELRKLVEQLREEMRNDK